MTDQLPLRFDGADGPADDARLGNQLERVKSVMRDGVWRTLDELTTQAHAPAASVSAQLRHLRKPRFGAHTVDKRHRGPAALGLFEYRLTINPGDADGVTGVTSRV